MFTWITVGLSIILQNLVANLEWFWRNGFIWF